MHKQNEEDSIVALTTDINLKTFLEAGGEITVMDEFRYSSPKDSSKTNNKIVWRFYDDNQKCNIFYDTADKKQFPMIDFLLNIRKEVIVL